MFSVFERTVAWRYLRVRRQDSFIAVISWFSLAGITLGVATLIIVMSVMNGFRHELLSRILGINGHLGFYSTAGGMEDHEEALQRIRQIPGVLRAHPMIERQVMVMAHGMTRGALVHGMTTADMKRHTAVSDHIVFGNFADFGAPGTALIGQKMAQKLSIPLGGTITLGAPEGKATALGVFPRFKKFKVVGFFDVGMREYDNNFIYIPLADAQKFFRTKDRVTGIEIFVKDPLQTGPYIQALQSLILPYQARVFDWQQANARFFSVIQVERNVMFLILMLIVLVASFNVVSSLVMLVKDKARDIAILRTMGASSASIRRIFVLVGSSVGVVGTLLGASIGLVFTAHIENIRQVMERLTATRLFPDEFYFLSRLPSRVDPYEVLFVVGVALFLAFSATLYPSWRAARTDPVKALRYE